MDYLEVLEGGVPPDPVGVQDAESLQLAANLANKYYNVARTPFRIVSGVYIKFEIHIFTPPLLDLYFFPK